MFDDLPLFRATDPATSRAAAGDIRIRRDSQLHKLLAVYGHPSAYTGLTADEAGQLSGLANNRSCCYWKRCSELRAKGLISDLGITRPGISGSEQIVCSITDDGLKTLGKLRMEDARNA